MFDFLALIISQKAVTPKQIWRFKKTKSPQKIDPLSIHKSENKRSFA